MLRRAPLVTYSRTPKAEAARIPHDSRASVPGFLANAVTAYPRASSGVSTPAAAALQMCRKSSRRSPVSGTKPVKPTATPATSSSMCRTMLIIPMYRRHHNRTDRLRSYRVR